MGSGWDTTECPTTTDNIAQPEATPREETSNTPRPRTNNQETRSQTPTPPSRQSQQNEVEHGQQTPTRRHDAPQIPRPVDPSQKSQPQPSPQLTPPRSEEKQNEFSTCPQQPVQNYQATTELQESRGGSGSKQKLPNDPAETTQELEVTEVQESKERGPEVTASHPTEIAQTPDQPPLVEIPPLEGPAYGGPQGKYDESGSKTPLTHPAHPRRGHPPPHAGRPRPRPPQAERSSGTLPT